MFEIRDFTLERPTAPCTVLDLLQSHAEALAGQAAFTFIGNDGALTETLTYAKLYARVSSLAAALLDMELRGRVAILAFPPSLEFIVGFLGCLLAGVIPAPCPLPKPGRGSGARLDAIARNAEASALLTTEAGLRQMRSAIDGNTTLAQLQRVACDDYDLSTAIGAWPHIEESAPALLQYTSGSTGDPKGVVITHGNLWANAQVTGPAFGVSKEARVVCWLPAYHDLGLIGNLLQTVYSGSSCYLMPPASLTQNPLAWLRAISRIRATVSMAPNFAYEMCTRRAGRLGDDSLDLSSWEVALSAAEPIRPQTVRAFCEAYKTHGFQPSAFRAAYGLAEATLVVSAGGIGEGIRVLDVDAGALEHGAFMPATQETITRKAVASSGRVLGGQEVLIVDPDSLELSGVGRIGEIWVTGQNVTNGYWRNADATRETFVTQAGGRRYLRTGDLGVIWDGELFVTGRIKEVLIIRGRNHYPQDIEHTLQSAHVAFRPAGGAAFSVESEAGEDLVLVQEIDRAYLRRSNFTELATAATGAIVEAHDIAPHDVVFVRPETVPKTSSGKIRRRRCREMYAEGKLQILFSSRNASEALDVRAAEVRQVAHECAPLSDSGGSALIKWLKDYLPRRVNSSLMDTRRCLSPHVVLDFGNQGLFGLECPPEFGGLGLPLTDTLRVMEQLGAADMTLANLVTLQNSLGVRPILLAARPALRSEILPALATGRQLAAFALTEPGAGSNPHLISSEAVYRGFERWALFGQKCWIGNAGWASVFNIFVQQRDSSGQAVGISGFVVREGVQGLRVGDEQMTMGLRGMVQNSVILDGVPVSSVELLGVHAQGMVVAGDAMRQARLYIAATCLGAAKRAVSIAGEYASSRRISTGLLIDNSDASAKLEAAILEIDGLEAFLSRLASAVDGGIGVPDELYAIAKIVGPEVLWRVLDDAAQMLGGRGYIETNWLPQAVRDARVMRVFEGPTEALKTFVGSALLTRPHGLAQFITNVCGEAELGSEVSRISDEVKSRAQDKSGTLDGALLAILAGEVARTVVLLASSRATTRESCPRRGAVVEKLELDYKRAGSHFRGALEGGKDGLLTTIELAGAIAGYRDGLCSMHSLAPREEWHTDPLLMKHSERRTEGAMLEQPRNAEESGDPAVPGRVDDAIGKWLQRRVHPSVLQSARSFAEMGLDSLGAVEFAHHLGQLLNLDIEDTVLWVYSNIPALREHLLARLQGNRVASANNPVARPGEMAW